MSFTGNTFTIESITNSRAFTGKTFTIANILTHACEKRKSNHHAPVKVNSTAIPQRHT